MQSPTPEEQLVRGEMIQCFIDFVRKLPKHYYNVFVLSEFEKLLSTLSSGEKAQILKWVVQELGDAFPGIDSRPDVCGGEACIVRTRIPVWLLEQARRLGATE